MQGILVYSASAIIQTLNYLKLDYSNDLKWIIFIYITFQLMLLLYNFYFN